MHKDLDEQTRQKLQANGIQHLHKKKRDEPNENLLELFSELSAVIEEELQRYVYPWPRKESLIIAFPLLLCCIYT